MSQNNISEVRKTSLEMVNKIFTHGMKYVKHKTIATFFLGIFKPRLESIIRKEAPEQELVEVMWMVKKDIDPLLSKFQKIEDVIDMRKLNEGTKAQAFVEATLLRDVQPYIPKQIKIDEQKAVEILMRLKNIGS